MTCEEARSVWRCNTWEPSVPTAAALRSPGRVSSRTEVGWRCSSPICVAGSSVKSSLVARSLGSEVSFVGFRD